MRLLERALWVGVLSVVALRPWVLDLVFPERIILVQWVGLALGLAWWASRQGWRHRLHPHLLVPCLVLFLAYLLSALLSRNHLEAFLEGQGLAFGMVLCAAIALARPPQRQQFLIVLTITGTVLALRALWQAAVLFPAFERLDWSQLTPQAHVANFVTDVIARRRVFGPFPLPALMAASLVILLPISVAVLHPWATTSKRRIVAIAVWGVQGTALYLTQSLGGVLTICTATLLIQTLLHKPWWQRAIMLGITILSVGSLLALRPELRMSEHPRNPIVQRWRYWNSTVAMIQDRPAYQEEIVAPIAVAPIAVAPIEEEIDYLKSLSDMLWLAVVIEGPIFGSIGAGDYATFYPNYRRPKATQTRFAHNVWLQVWVEYGILGLVGLIGLFVGSIRLVASQPTGIQVALWGFWMIASIDITWSIFQVACLWWPLLGLLSPPERSS